MYVTIKRPQEVCVTTMKVTLKVRDEFSCSFHDVKGNQVSDYEGYVPKFMPGEHYGDYVELEINLADGKINNWKQLKAEDIQPYVSPEEDDDE